MIQLSQVVVQEGCRVAPLTCHDSRVIVGVDELCPRLLLDAGALSFSGVHVWVAEVESTCIVRDWMEAPLR